MAFPVMCGVIGHAGAGNRECKEGLRMGLLAPSTLGACPLQSL